MHRTEDRSIGDLFTELSRELSLLIRQEMALLRLEMTQKVSRLTKAGAYFVSPFVGRLDDIGQNGMDLIRDVVQIYSNYEFKTQVLVASVRHPIHVVQAALMGADICTLPAKVFEQMLKHPLTDRGVEQFFVEWKCSPDGAEQLGHELAVG